MMGLVLSLLLVSQFEAPAEDGTGPLLRNTVLAQCEPEGPYGELPEGCVDTDGDGIPDGKDKDDDGDGILDEDDRDDDGDGYADKCAKKANKKKNKKARNKALKKCKIKGSGGGS
jgi:hypothetical protein